MARKKLECFGGPLCGSLIPDTNELWMGIQSVKNPDEEHYYKRVKITDYLMGKSVLIWHYHGQTPEGPGVPMIKPAKKKFK